MRVFAKLAAILILVVAGQIAFDVIAAATSYPGFTTSTHAATADADAAFEVEQRLAGCNVASRWVASQVLGFAR